MRVAVVTLHVQNYLAVFKLCISVSYFAQRELVSLTTERACLSEAFARALAVLDVDGRKIHFIVIRTRTLQDWRQEEARHRGFTFHWDIQSKNCKNSQNSVIDIEIPFCLFLGYLFFHSRVPQVCFVITDSVVRNHNTEREGASQERQKGPHGPVWASPSTTDDEQSNF